MDLATESLEAAKDHLAHRGDYAPAEVFAAMLALEDDPTRVKASVAARKADAAATVWRAAWVTAERLTFCEAVREDDGGYWSFDAGQALGGAEPRISAWSARTANVHCIRVTAARARGGGRSTGGVMFADAVWAVETTHGGAFTVPLFGGFTHRSEATLAEGFMLALRAAV